MRVVPRIRINSPELPELDESLSEDGPTHPVQEILDVYGNIAALDLPDLEIVGFVVIEPTFLNWFSECQLDRVRAAMGDYFACLHRLKVEAKIRRRAYRALLAAVRKLARRLLGTAGTPAPPAVLRLGRPPPPLRTSGGQTDFFPALC